MIIADSEKEFSAFLASHGKVLKALLPEELLQLGFDFFAQVRADDALPVTQQHMGDALLFQWGTRRALPGHYGACFYFDLTRQFISQTGEDDDAMFQLTCELRYEATEELGAIGSGNRWCESLEVLPEFKNFAFGHSALAAVRGKTPNEVEFHLSGV